MMKSWILIIAAYMHSNKFIILMDSYQIYTKYLS